MTAEVSDVDVEVDAAEDALLAEAPAEPASVDHRSGAPT